MTLEEVEQRVSQSLEALNREEERYDWRLTHYNFSSWESLEEGCYELSEGRATEEQLKALIKTFRDRSQVSYIDWHIKVPEPGVKELARAKLLFDLASDVRLVPPRYEPDRKNYRAEKIVNVMNLTMEFRQHISEKLRQQFHWLMIREQKNLNPEILAVQVKFEEYNPFQKKLSQAPTVTLEYHLSEEQKLTKEEAPAPIGDVPVSVDNSSFEARMAPAPEKAARSPRGGRKVTYSPALPPKPEPPPEAPHEMPAEIHEEFAAYCQNLYEKAKGN